MPHGRRKFLDATLAICTSDRNLLILDEPTQGLDSEQVRLVAHLINRLR